MKKKYTEEKLAKMWCELNIWRVPKELQKYIREYQRERIIGAMIALELFTTVKSRMDAWNKRKP